MSPILQFVLYLGGVLTGLTLAGGLLWRQHQALVHSRHDATHDDTTGMPNRRLFLTRLHAAQHAGHPVGVVLLDLDAFKSVNDTFGHETGNEMLTEIGRRLTALGRPVILAARLSGDEFVLLVAGDTGSVDAAARAAWRAVARRPLDVAGSPVSVRASVGYATAGPGANAKRTLRRADEAMYIAKITGVGVYGANNLPTRAAAPNRRHRDDRAHRTPTEP